MTTVGLSSPVASGAATQLWRCGLEAATGHTQVDDRGCVLIKLYLQKRGQGRGGAPVWPSGPRLQILIWTPGLSQRQVF